MKLKRINITTKNNIPQERLYQAIFGTLSRSKCEQIVFILNCVLMKKEFSLIEESAVSIANFNRNVKMVKEWLMNGEIECDKYGLSKPTCKKIIKNMIIKLSKLRVDVDYENEIIIVKKIWVEE